MSTETLITLLVAFVVVVYWYFRKTYSYWSNKNIQSLPWLPVIGSSFERLLQKRPHYIINNDLYNKHYGEKIVAGYRGLEPELLIYDPDLIRMVLVKDFNNFTDRAFPANEKEPITQHIVGAKGTAWKNIRQKLTPTFTSAKMKAMFPLMVENSKGLERMITELLKTNDVQDARELMARFTTDTIGSCGFGLNMNSIADDNSVFRNEGKYIFEPSKVRFAMTFLYSVMPKVIDFIRLTRLATIPYHSDRFFTMFVKQLFKERGNSPSNRHDFVDLMMTMRRQQKLDREKNPNSDEYVLTDELITAQFFLFFLAGFETSSTTLSFTLYELSKNPNVQKKLQDEIDEILENHKGNITYEAVHEMKYLQAVIDETLRLYPPIPHLDRVCNTAYKLPGTDIVIDKGVNIWIPMYSLHHDAKYFPEPEVFQPERFVDEANKTYPAFAYFPFGFGPRNCLGLRFARLQVAVGLATVLRNHSLEMCEKTPINLELSSGSLFMGPVGDIPLRITPRISTS